MGEIIKARRPEYIAKEIAMKVHYYNILRQMAEALLIMQHTSYVGNL